jgi:hypothetical protein
MTRRIEQLAAAPTGAEHSAPRRSRHHAGRRRGRRRRMRGRGRHPASGWTAPSAPAACPRRLSPPAASTASPIRHRRHGRRVQPPRRRASAQPDRAAYRRNQLPRGACSSTRGESQREAAQSACFFRVSRSAAVSRLTPADRAFHRAGLTGHLAVTQRLSGHPERVGSGSGVRQTGRQSRASELLKVRLSPDCDSPLVFGVR